MSVAAVQETKWFGKDIWQAGGYLFITSGRSPLSDGEPAVRHEGMGIVLDEEATAAWKEAEESWKAVSSRIITMRMKLARAGQQKPVGDRETSNIFVTVISVYAPTARAHLRVAQKFMKDLQETIDKVPALMYCCSLETSIHVLGLTVLVRII